MNELPQIEAPKTHRRRRWVLFALVLAPAAVLGYVWWNDREAQRELERQLVGAWSIEPDPTPKGTTYLEYDLRPDRTCQVRCRNLKTGSSTTSTRPIIWWVSGGKLCIRHPDTVPSQPWHIFPAQRAYDEVLAVTPNGPDHFRYEAVIRARSVAAASAVVSGANGPPIGGTMTRVPPTEHPPH